MGRLTAVVFSLLMLAMSISVAVNSLNENVEISTLEDFEEPQNVILPLAQLNKPGFQEGSIYTNTTFSSGGMHNCAILDNGAVSCWGSNDYGQLGNGGTSDRVTPGLTNSLGIGRTAVAVSSGGIHTCAILDDGSVSCWGGNNFGQIGDGTNTDRSTPTQISSLGTGRTAVAISSGVYRTCAILDTGEVSCWGYGDRGAIGNGATDDKTTPTSTSSLGTGRTAIAISTGGVHTCALLDNGAVSCWGRGGFGSLGNGISIDRSSPTLTSSFGSERTAVAISSARAHTCAILDNGSVSCWGEGSSGNIGSGAAFDVSTPTLTSSLGVGRYSVAISSGSDHTCAVLDNGNVTCWGTNWKGGLGDGTTNDRFTPTQTSSLGTGTTAVAISSGSYHTCAILDNGSASCWGWNLEGNLGNGGTSDKSTPTPISSLGVGRTVALSERDFDDDGTLNIFDNQPYIHSPGFQEESIYTSTTLSSGGAHTCAKLDNGKVSCWGYGDRGQLGHGGTSNKNKPTLTSSLGTGRTAVTLSSGGSHTCAILDNGTVSCWGAGDSGQLGNGGTSNKTTPTLTSSLGPGIKAVSISSGKNHTCAILDNGAVSCWGSNHLGKLGNGGTSDAATPTLTSSLGVGRTALAISTGWSHTCALLDNGEVSCWGGNGWGQLGNGGAGNHQSTPTLTSSLGVGRVAVAISTGNQHTCALLENGSVSCWGIDHKGQLGHGGNTTNDTPTLTSSLGANRTAIAISSGGYHTCAILDNGSVSCWGWGIDGALGNGGTADKNIPIITNSLGAERTAIAISSGRGHTCAILDNGSVTCWGYGVWGALGNGDNFQKNSPTLASSLGEDRTVDLSERDFDRDSILNIFEDFICSPGSYLSGSTCIQADAGYFVSFFGQMSQTPCPVGTYQDSTGQNSCLEANAGYYVDVSLGKAQTAQTPCPEGTYNPTNGATSPGDCLAAEPGYYTDASSGLGQSTQIPCPAGSYQTLTGQTSCDDADAGFYVDETLGTGQTNQTACPTGTYQAQTGQTSCDGADAGFYVDSSLGVGQSTQTPCPAGSYQTLTDQTSCDGADAGNYVDETLGTGQTNQTPCQAGTYQALTGQTSCEGANAGFYVDPSLGVGQSSQTPCPKGTYNPDTNSTSSSDCIGADVGHYVDYSFPPGQSSQTPCPAGTYNPDIESIYSDFCEIADEGYYVNASLGTGQASQTPCPSGTFSQDSGNTNLSDCIVTGVGYYANSSSGIGQMKQTPCLLGTYQAAVGQGACDDADIGYFVDLMGAHAQEECAKGEFQPLSGQSKCNLADPSYYVGAEGRKSQLPCTNGTYSNLSGSVECMDAGPGHYVLNSDKSQRIQCPSFTYTYVDENTSGNTSDELSDCWVDTDGDTLVDDDSAFNFDDDDDNDGYNDLIDAFPLDSSEWNDLNSDGVGDNQKPLNAFENMETVVGTTLSFAIIFVLPIGIIVGIVLILKSRKKSEVKELPVPVFEPITTPLPAIINSGPPLPAEGLPIGWTMEQWVYYGEQWLSKNMAAAVPEPVQFQPELISQTQQK